ncbi:MAG: prepilin-type N-terminal cleavage/methylation domain-containing protein [Elusimicrobia bacterium]|nr:prepilin-type N-terminal cleavage/methylation domain-containing protein [Elusimicrobiota bacterium]
MSKTIFSKRGLTLLEVMIALSIFAIAGTVALNTCFIASRHMQIINDEKNLILLAKVKTEECELGITDIERERNGSFPEPYQEYLWEIALTDIAITDTEYNITFSPYKLTVKSPHGEYSVLSGFVQSKEGGKE